MAERIYSRSNAVKLIDRIYSHTADRDNWSLWYGEAWDHLINAGLATVETPLDLILVRMRVMALRWLTLDFCAALNHDYWNSNPFWSDWAGGAGVDARWSAWTLQADDQAAEIIKESKLCQSRFVEEEDGEIVFNEEVCDDVSIRLLVLAVFRQREKVWEVLNNGFDCLYASLAANLVDTFDLIWDRKSNLHEQLDALEVQLKLCGESDEAVRISSLISDTQYQLEQDRLHEYAINCLRDKAVFERGPAFQWCEECCPVVNCGTPGVSLNRG